MARAGQGALNGLCYGRGLVSCSTVNHVLRFAVMVLSVMGSVHTYVWLRLVHDPSWGAPAQAVGTAVIAALFAVMTVGMLLRRRLPEGIRNLVTPIAHYWLVTVFLALVFTVIFDVVFLLGTIVYSLVDHAPTDEQRRLLSQIRAGLSLGSTFVACGLALIGGSRPPTVKRVRVPLKRLPPALEGTTIAQISDLHITSRTAPAEIVALVDRVNALEPTLVAITGDLIDGPVDELCDAAAGLARFRTQHGTYFVTGNHEYYAGADPWVEYLTEIGIRVLQNERVPIGDQHASFDLAGVHDPTARAVPKVSEKEVERACAGRDDSRELVLLAHRPRTVVEAAQCGVGLQLSGHTHGGQIWPWGLVVRMTEPYVKGLHRYNGSTYVYVSCGTGLWGPAMRLGAAAEITLLELVRE